MLRYMLHRMDFLKIHLSHLQEKHFIYFAKKLCADIEDEEAQMVSLKYKQYCWNIFVFWFLQQQQQQTIKQFLIPFTHHHVKA